MNKTLFFILAQLIVANVIGQNNPDLKRNLMPLHWLVGTWERANVKAGIKAHEKWHLDSADHLKGLGVTMRGQDTLFVERIEIRMAANNFYYIADVKENKAPVYFKFTTLSNDAFVCENPGHDFPKKIEYSFKDSTLTVRISGDGKSQDYLFVRR